MRNDSVENGVVQELRFDMSVTRPGRRRQWEKYKSKSKITVEHKNRGDSNNMHLHGYKIQTPVICKNVVSVKICVPRHAPGASSRCGCGRTSGSEEM